MMNERNNKNILTSNDKLANMTKTTSPKSPVWPNGTIGWLALGFSVAAMASWVVLPLVTTIFRNAYPITDTWIMPAIGTALIDLAAITNVFVVWRLRERSAMNIVATALTIPMALLFTFIVIGETLGGA